MSIGKTISDATPATKIITAVADREGVDPTELDPPLYEAIDPDALNTLFGNQQSSDYRVDGWLSFTYAGYDITVAGDGTVRVAARRDNDYR